MVIQAKLLTESINQSFALAFTGNLYVYRLTTTALNSDDLGLCDTFNEEVAVQLEMSLMELVNRNGWNENSQYVITRNETKIKSGSLQKGLFYQIDDICVTSSSYSAKLILKGALDAPLLSIPACNVLLAPLKYSETFDVEVSSIEISPKCTTSCRKNHHISLSLLLFEGGCGGWGGAYFAIQSMSSIDGDGFVGGTLEWDCLQTKDVCLPAEKSCYIIKLYVPFQLVDEDYDPIILLSEKANSSCPFYLSRQVTIAKLCVHTELMSGTIDFFNATTLDNRDKIETWQMIHDRMIQTEAIGSCDVKLDLHLIEMINSTVMPSVTPEPTSVPSSYKSLIPTMTPSFSPTVATFRPSVINTSIPLGFWRTESPKSSPTLAPPAREPSMAPSLHPSIHKPRPSNSPSTNLPTSKASYMSMHPFSKKLPSTLSPAPTFLDLMPSLNVSEAMASQGNKTGPGQRSIAVNVLVEGNFPFSNTPQ